MKVLVLDNYDSFVYNIVHVLSELGYAAQMTIARNDKIALKDVESFDKVLLSPGPGIPDEGGIMKDLIKEYGASKSILGICLGHQAIAEVYGAKLFNMKEVLHGVEGTLQSHNDQIFNDLPADFKVAHYHSWSVDLNSITSPLKVMAMDTKGLVMGITHESYDVKGLQFHPESVMTKEGTKIIKNWMESNQ